MSRRWRPRVLLAAALLLGARSARAAETGFLDRAFEVAGATYRYQVASP